jgi:hypothetical protein
MSSPSAIPAATAAGRRAAAGLRRGAKGGFGAVGAKTCEAHLGAGTATVFDIVVIANSNPAAAE